MKPKRKGNQKINDQIKESIYNLIMNHPQVVQSPIFNDFMKVNIDGNTEPKIVPALLLQVYVQEIHNSLVSDPVDGRLKETRYENNNIIIRDYTSRSLLPPQLNFFHQYIRLCVVVNVVYMPKVYIPHYYHGVIGIKKIKDKSQNA